MQHQQVDGNSNSDKLEKLEHNESADLDEIAKRGHVSMLSRTEISIVLHYHTP